MNRESVKALEVIHARLNDFLDVPFDVGAGWVSPHQETMLLIGKFFSSCLIAEPLSQNAHVFSSLLGAGLIIAAGIEKDWAFDALDKPGLISAIEFLDIQGRVNSCDGLNVVVFGRHAESSPCSPAISGSNKILKTLTFGVSSQFFILGFDLLHFLLLDYLQNFGDVLDGALVNWFQELWQKHCKSQVGVGISDDLVPSALNSKDVLKKDQRPSATSDFIDFQPSHIDYSALGGVVDLESRP